MSEVRAFAGVPTLTHFAGLGAPSTAAPIVVDSTTGFLYTWKTGDVIVLAGGGAGTVTHGAGNLTANAIVVGNAVADIDVLASLGTTTTVLHGNAAGRPTFGSIVAADVSANAITNSLLAQMAANTVKGNNTAGTANALDLTAAQMRTLLAVPQQTTGAWTPADNSGAALTFTSVSANYTQIGNMIFAYASWTYPANASGASASISGLPVASANANYAQVPSVVDTSASITGGLVCVPVKNTTTANFDVGTPFGPATNLQLSGATIATVIVYPAT